MRKKYIDSMEYYRRRQDKILRHKIRQKNRKKSRNKSNNNNHTNNVKPPIELVLFKKKDIKIKTNVIKLPNVFSFTRNPNETIKKIYEITSLFFQNRDLTISILCEHTKNIDLSALIILSSIIVKGKLYLKHKGYKCKISGDLPKDKEAQEIFIFSGLPKHLNMLNGISPEVEILDPFSTIDDTNLETHRIIEYYNKCLQRNGYQLNEKGEIYFHSLINEIVDNARIHSGYKNKFYCGGFYSHNIRKGQLSIINFGNTIYESLNSHTTNLNIKEKIKEYINYQKKFYDISYKEEMSWTVFALQYKISRLNSIQTPDRGTGTIRFIEAFMLMGQTIHNDKPIMSLTSGNTHILFDGTYTLKEQLVKNETLKVIAFNKNNDLKDKPDRNYVKDMHMKFPGVIINIEFFLDSEYLEKFKEVNNEE